MSKFIFFVKGTSFTIDAENAQQAWDAGVEYCKENLFHKLPQSIVSQRMVDLEMLREPIKVKIQQEIKNDNEIYS